jgi:hypothetical protein
VGLLVMTGESCGRTKRKSDAIIKRNIKDTVYEAVAWTDVVYCS